MDNERRFYTYAYLREDGTPYYIGKGTGRRAFDKARRTVTIPPKERVLFLKTGLTEEEAFKHEIYMIALYGRKDLGTGILYNFTDGGEGASVGHPVSKETREKIRRAHLGKKASLEAREKMRRSQTGKKRAPEAVEKTRQANLGKPLSQERREKISRALTGKKLSPETREKVRQASLRQWEKTYLWFKNPEGTEDGRFVIGNQPEGWERGRKKWK
jgi:DNA-binding cell septation regulator SpoVG